MYICIYTQVLVSLNTLRNLIIYLQALPIGTLHLAKESKILAFHPIIKNQVLHTHPKV